MGKSNISDAVNVVYIAGTGRSGSTVLQRVLSKAKDIIEVGELRHIWIRGLLENQLCGCNKRFNSCDFWGAVIEEAFPGLSNEEILNRVTPYLDLFDFRTLFRAGTERTRKRISNFCKFFLFPLYSSISLNSSGKIIMDSSKTPAYLFLLQNCPGINLKVIHLVRDSRAIAFSWKKRKLRPEIVGKLTDMPQLSIYRSASMWLLSNMAIEILKNNIKFQYCRVLYEDFVGNPAYSVRTLLDFIGIREDPDKFVSEGKVILEPAHSVSGNPMRFDRGSVILRSDDLWRDKMNSYDKLIVFLMTWPLLFHYY
ncbi:MAG: hypothetical protein A2Y81_04420 [Nitrospirae bacterium RBG_13_43_8]|nr:MAG: hypothetical protein A2Y81_04420 [Nitrospirae bacterium RBG_13_43_8]